MEHKWFVRVVRFDGSKGIETQHKDYVEAKIAFDNIEQLSENDREKAGGRVRITNATGIALKVGLVA